MNGCQCIISSTRWKGCQNMRGRLGCLRSVRWERICERHRYRVIIFALILPRICDSFMERPLNPRGDFGDVGVALSAAKSRQPIPHEHRPSSRTDKATQCQPSTNQPRCTNLACLLTTQLSSHRSVSAIYNNFHLPPSTSCAQASSWRASHTPFDNDR
jgi:hypothetical protein